MLVIVLELIMISDKGFYLFMAGEGTEGFGHVLSSSRIMATLASPIIMLFIGGFFLAMAATKYRLDINLARVMLRPFGTNPKFIMLGLMIITAVFSMFMSNTATTAMMLSILAPVLATFDVSDRARVSYTLSITLAANVGGIGTPIGTPPNAIAFVYITQLMPMSFGQWMLFAVPFVFVLILFSWWMLVIFFPIKKKKMELQIDGKFEKGGKAYVVYGTFAVTILLWVLGDLHGMDSNVVAMIPIAVFFIRILSQSMTSRTFRGKCSGLWPVALPLAMPRNRPALPRTWCTVFRLKPLRPTWCLARPCCSAW